MVVAFSDICGEMISFISGYPEYIYFTPNLGGGGTINFLYFECHNLKQCSKRRRVLEALIKLGQVVAKQLSTAITLVLSNFKRGKMNQGGQNESRGGGGVTFLKITLIFETGFT